jgi:N6-adenosine-specific RNA methylase IME4
MSEVKRGAASQYAVLDNVDIQDLPVREVAADDAILVLWVPASLMSAGLITMQSWGFSQKTQIVWVKSGKNVDPSSWEEEIPEDLALAFGMGRTFRGACEFALVGTRGKILQKLENKSIRNVFLAPNLRHSQKPDCVAEALERMFPQCRPLELFGRRARPGWTVRGDQAPDSLGEDIRVSLEKLAAHPEGKSLLSYESPSINTQDNPFAL